MKGGVYRMLTKKSGFKKKNGLQIITRERVRFNI